MSLYHLLENTATSDLDDLGNLLLDLVAERRAAENAEQDQRCEVSADVRANHHGAHADSLTEDLAAELERLFPGIRTLELATSLRSAA